MNEQSFANAARITPFQGADEIKKRSHLISKTFSLKGLRPAKAWLKVSQRILNHRGGGILALWGRPIFCLQRLSDFAALLRNDGFFVGNGRWDKGSREREEGIC